MYDAHWRYGYGGMKEKTERQIEKNSINLKKPESTVNTKILKILCG